MSSTSPPATTSKRPKDTNLTQQRLPSRCSNFGNLGMAIVFVIIGIMFLPIGTTLLNNANQVYEDKITYDGGSSSNCSITYSNQGKYCEVTFNLTQSVTGPIYVYYKITNFYQNHRRYFQSKSINQLQGEVLSASTVSLDCSPLYQNGSILLNPCGLIANSFFNDVIELKSNYNGISMDESGISLQSDRDALYLQVNGFQSHQVPNSSVSCTSVGLPTSCKTYFDNSTNTYYKYYYPNDDTTQYLYETYPNQISPLKGVTDEHFIVWMKVDILPTFRKLYGKIDGNFNKGDVLTFGITANYEVDSFDGTKALLISSLGSYGGKNIFPGQAFLTIGAFCIIIGGIYICRVIILRFMKSHVL